MNNNFVTLLTEAAQVRPDKPFLLTADLNLTYAQVDLRSSRIAAGLHSLGIRVGDVVALLLPNSPEFVNCYFGILKLGAIAAPLNVTSPAPELAHYLNDSGARLLVTSPAGLSLALQSTQQVEALQQILVTGAADPQQTAPNIHWLEALLSTVLTEPAEPARVGKDDPALLLYTSGTTGKPKAARITHANILAFTPVFGSEVLELDHNSVVLMVAPGSHAIGQVLLNTALYAGCALSLLPRFEPQLFLQAIQRDRVTSFISVPTLIRILLTAPQVTAESLRSLQVIMIGGAALSPELARQFKQRFDVRLKVSYAMTEAYAITFGEIGEIPDGSVGRPAAGVSLKLVDETNQDVGPGEAGEVLVKSPQVFAGYHNFPEQAAVYWLDGWFRTGDVGYQDEHGNLFLVGRRKEIIKSSGYTIYPAEVEDVLLSHPGVAMAVVAGVPYKSSGDIVVAFVVPRPGEPPTANELIRYCKERLASYKCPRRVEFRQLLPLNSAGKVLRNKLVEELV